jgi:hypothetical protein
VVTILAAAMLAATPDGRAQSTRPATAVSAAADSNAPDCPRLWREYRRSQACFAPYRTINGIKAEAFRVCGPDLPDPSAQCGPVRDPSSSQRTR